MSMPVAYVAIGRRLGYPLKLALAKGHIFCRWDGAGERLNIEATNRGMSTYEDDHYRTWPQKLTSSEVASGRFLRSLAPPEELAMFLASRGHCLLDNGRLEGARAAYGAAHRLAPIEKAYLGWERQAAARLRPAPSTQRSPHSGRPGQVPRVPSEATSRGRAIPGPKAPIQTIGKKPRTRIPPRRVAVPGSSSADRAEHGFPKADPKPHGPRQ